ncbi:MAG TPA: GNAT family N-acetyltransferase [Candidatus Binatia bacterium]|nr:GNAT family N-acetyltransferase [Candidatus Binatia bacterium]
MQPGCQSAHPIHIIEASEADGLQLAALIHLLLEEPDLVERGIHFDPDSGSVSQAYYIIQRAQKSEGFVLLARSGRRPAGMLLSAKQTLAGPEKTLVLTIVVEARSRRQGIGEALMRYAERIAPHYGVASLTLSVLRHNEPAIALYRKLGFRERAPTGSLDGETDSDRYLYMSKKLEE